MVWEASRAVLHDIVHIPTVHWAVGDVCDDGTDRWVGRVLVDCGNEPTKLSAPVLA
jgi:hypothetical protein